MFEKYPKKYMSYSQIDAYLRCPYCFKVKYVDGLATEDTKYLVFGRLIHSLFENYGDNKPMMEEVFHHRIIEESAIFEDREDAMKFYQKGKDAIKNYHDSDIPKMQVVAKEKMFNVNLISGLPNLFGFIDLVYGNPDIPETWNIVDYKTSASVKPKASLSTDLQMPIYALVMHKKHGAFPSSIEYFYPVINKRQRAIHIGEGVYEYQNQREPVVRFNAFDALPVIQQVYEDIMEEKFDDRAMHFFCTNECKSLGGWGVVPDYGGFK
jgi:RecB family exonuclease